MTRSEISGYVQIIVGALGIIATILFSPAMLDALSQVSAKGTLPSQFSSLSGAVQLFAVLFVMFCFMLLLMIGLSLVLSPVFRALGSGLPFLTGLFAIMTMMGLAVSTTLAVLGINYWIAAFIATFVFVWLTFASTAREDEEGSTISSLATIAVIGSIVFLITGFACVVANAPRNAYDETMLRKLNESSPSANGDDR